MKRFSLPEIVATVVLIALLGGVAMWALHSSRASCEDRGGQWISHDRSGVCVRYNPVSRQVEEL